MTDWQLELLDAEAGVRAFVAVPDEAILEAQREAGRRAGEREQD